jgi:hypothetical protein
MKGFKIMSVHHPIKKKIIAIFSILFLPLLFLNGCLLAPNYPNQYYYGDIQINSIPANASIYLDGIYTGYASPKIIPNISVGNHLITLKLEGYLNSNNIIPVYPQKTSTLEVILTPIVFPPSPYVAYLTNIEANPDSFYLATGETKQINSIIAYYSDGTSKEIPFNQCSIFSLNQEIASVSPTGQVSGLSEGETTIWVTYTENNIKKSDFIPVYVSGETVNPGELVKIEVLPETMDLDIGESQSILSIRAYYDNNTNCLISPNWCDFSVDNGHASIDNEGIITGISNGVSIITISYEENGGSKSDFITVTVSSAVINQPVYRSLLIGIGDYIYYEEEGDLLAPPYDVNKMVEIIEDCRFNVNQTSFQKINTLKDQQATKQNIINKIQSTFSGADENDVSYFYFSGHGALVNQVSYLCPADFNGQISSAISVDELESALSAVAGTKVVFIDSCNSGGFIGKSMLETEEFKNMEYLTQFNEGIISAFANHTLSKDLLTSAEYQVLTSSHWYEESYEIDPADGEPFGIFTQALYEGCSLANNTPADTNQNDIISLSEAYNFISQWVAAMRVNQNVQVYPINSSFTIFEY